MTASVEIRLLSKVLEVGDLRPLIDKKITVSHFQGDGAKGIFKRILSFYNSRETNGEVPSLALIERDFPKEDFPRKERSTVQSLVEEFLSGYVTTQINVLAGELGDMADKPDEAIKYLGKRYAELAKHRRVSEDYELSASVDQVRQAYEAYRDNDGYLGIPYPWEVLNYETGGMLDGEFVILYGRPKSMKTWLLLACACHAYDRASRRVLICTREMTPQQIMNRCICILIRCPYTAFKHGSMKSIPVPEGGTMEDRFYSYLDTMKTDEGICAIETGKNKGLIVTSDRADPDGGGVMGLREKVKDHRPDNLYVDAMYLMKDDRENKRSIKWGNQTAISQDIKDLALDFNIPVMGTNQANRDSEDSEGKSVRNIAFSDSFGMDCDLAIEIIKRSTPDKEVNELALAITASREINMTGFPVHGNAASDFGSILTQKMDADGVVVLDRKGNPVLQPVIFSDYGEMREFFKDQKEEKEPTTRAAHANLARKAWEGLKHVKPSRKAKK